jgi:CHASE2 domain-containing sensor protein
LKLADAISGFSRRTYFAAAAFLILVALAAGLSRPVENFVRDLMMATLSPWTDPPDDIILVTIT